MKKNRVYSFLIFFFFALLVIAHHVYGYFGHYGYDDLHYAELATQLWQGQLDYTDHYSYRLAILLPTALAYTL
jgi:hypothetical protein